MDLIMTSHLRLKHRH
uniref:Uncharacterized protein n=1 Tax=Anguilla anguilla TaxID=7936 RepID=A0A0E9V7M1_ANGAN